MPSKRAFRVLALLVVLFAVGFAAAAEKGDTHRTPLRHGLSLEASSASTAGPASAIRILRSRLAETLRLIRELDSRPNPPSFGTDGLSDGPDPIDAKDDPSDTGSARKQRDTTDSDPANGSMPSEHDALGPR
jgi:hypothetical protein